MRIVLSACMLLTVSGCGEPRDKRIILAVVGDKKITISDFNERIANLPARFKEVVKKKKKEYLEELINDTLLYQEAIRRNLFKDKDVQKVIEEAEKKILIARLLKDEVDSAITISESDITKFYEENKNKYMTPEIMRVSHILVSSQEEAAKILEKLSEGAEFEDLARAKSVDPTAQQGGDIGYFPKGQLMPEFENACNQLDINEISGVVKTTLGYHIIKLTDRKNPKPRQIEKVTDDISARLRMVKRQKIFNELLSKLREATAISINEQALVVSDESGGENK